MAVKKEKVELTSDIRCFNIEATFLSPCLGTAPSDPLLYEKFLIDSALELEYLAARKAGDTDRIDRMKAGMMAHELSSLPGQQAGHILANSSEEVRLALPAEEQEGAVKGLTVFRRTATSKTPMLVGYMLRGFYKEAFDSHTDIPMPASKVDKFLWIGEFEVPIFRDGKLLDNVDGEWSRPLRTKDPKTGVSRVCIPSSEFVNPLGNTSISFTLFVMAKGFSAAYNGGKFRTEDIERVTHLGLAFGGLGQFRNGGHGCLQVTNFKETTVDWKTALATRIQLLKDGQQLYAGKPKPLADAVHAEVADGVSA
jgi:hypothetical protein